MWGASLASFPTVVSSKCIVVVLQTLRQIVYDTIDPLTDYAVALPIDSTLPLPFDSFSTKSVTARKDDGLILTIWS